ncbi:hypothetical protein [Spiroplasma taiwanense]|uniref:Uncharacterized protein n=1 Tax=Spiroplasma taiwanense CT-1 TaxID=1276220 RepID=S5M001_9MOLU|nr:hypothetical protein [Spiroplasma taiwanense]AGR41327.1 hypothetical protein STAIW_v1c07130 [Spiroplasma taiwanense CT-1]
MTLIDKKIYFNNMIFQNEEDLYSYAKQNAKKSSYSFDTKEYIFDDKLFNNSILLNNYIKEKFNIIKEFTNRNIQEFVINTAGELNSLVEMDNNDSIYEIFEGNDSLSYLSENEAKKTFSKNIKKNFAIENKYFENWFSAKEYLKNIKIAELEENKTSECYIVSSICYTKDELTTNIRNEIYSGFILEGNEFSDLNYSEFLEYTKVLSDKTINKYITENINAKYNSYWINHETKNSTGTFSGPQYVETENKLDTKLEFNLVSNTAINQNFVNIALLGSVLKIFINLSNKEIIEENDFKLDNFLNLNYKKLNISQENYNLINSFLQNNRNLSSQINQNLNKIKSSDFTPTHKLMVAFKRISELNKIYDLKVEEINIEKLLKDIMLEIILANDNF